MIIRRSASVPLLCTAMQTSEENKNQPRLKHVNRLPSLQRQYNPLINEIESFLLQAV